MKPGFSYSRAEPYVFFAVLLVSTWPALMAPYFATLDGPAHLYNSVLLNDYSGNEVIRQYYRVSQTLSPNLFNHVFYAFFNLLFEARISEKIFIVFYFLAFPLSLRYFIKSYNPQNAFLSLLGIPLSHSCLLYMGFFNFSVSFVFMFMAIAYYYRHMYRKETVNLPRYVWLFVFISLIYISNVLCFVYALAVLGIYELHSINGFYRNHLKQLILPRLLKDIAVVLPALLCLLYFYTRMDFPPDDSHNNFKELCGFITDFKSLLVYDRGSDVFYTRILLLVLAFLSVYTAIKHLKVLRSLLQTHTDSLLFLGLTLAVLIAYFKIPNGSNAGMMTDRLCNLLFVSLLLWIACQKQTVYPKVLSLVIIIPHFFLWNIHTKTQKHYNEVAAHVAESGKYMDANSVVLPVNVLSRWFFVTHHAIDYAATTGNPLIMLDNYEAVMPWFPLNWNLDHMPRLTLNHKDQIAHTYWPPIDRQFPVKEIDYVYLLGDIHDLEEEKWTELKMNLDSAYVPHHMDPANKIFIFKHK